MLPIALFFFLSGVSVWPSSQQFAELGSLRLENGDTLLDCRVGYRTFGRLDASGGNGVLVTTWFQGTSGELSQQIGPGKLVDSSKFYVIAVDALGNGVSSSPSNSLRQSGQAFPRFSMRDMVESQHRLVTEHLHVKHLKAVVGTSMGGMQAFQWATDYPAFMDKAIAIAGSPRSQSDDRARWKAAIEIVQMTPRWRRTMQALARLAPLEAAFAFRVDPVDYVRQAEAIIALDVSASFGGSLERAASGVRASMLVASSLTDEVVNPEPARQFARLARGQVLELDGACGHRAPTCEKAALRSAVAGFLSR